VQRRLLSALANEPTATPYAADYRAAHDLPPSSTLQSARVALEREETVGRDADGLVGIAEPFFAEWIKREQRQPSLMPEAATAET
jgi:hypothetical protein